MSDAAETVKNVFATVTDAVKGANPKFKAQAASETDGKFITRVLEGLAEISDEAYQALSPDAQTWFKEAADKVNVGQTPSLPEGFTSAYAESAPSTTTKPAVTRGGKGKGKDKETAPAAEGKPPAETKNRVGRTKQDGPTIGETVRRAVIENRDVKLAELEAKLAAAGFQAVKKSTVFSFQRGAIDTLKVAEAMGRFSWS